jgi:hypothetical protein
MTDDSGQPAAISSYFQLYYTISGNEYTGGEFGLYKAGVWDTTLSATHYLWFQLHE